MTTKRFGDGTTIVSRPFFAVNVKKNGFLHMSRQQNHHPTTHGILVAEDTALLALEVVDVLESTGLQVLGPAVSVVKALKLLDEYHAAAAVLDWNLRDGTSEVVAQRLLDDGVPFVFYTSDVAAVRARWPGVPVLAKHRSILSLVPIVSALLELARTRPDDERDGRAA